MTTTNTTNGTLTAKKAIDRTSEHAWIVLNPKHGVLTDDGLEFIANHQYKAGTYTWLDNVLNPFWTQLTELLPLWLAPNMVTTLGALHTLFSYALTWYYAPNLNTWVPSWVIVVNAYCAIAYYTLDCMDGKQARRTKSSSPLGQLFDHGFDCISNLSHLSSISAYTMIGGSRWLVATQSSLQFSFFMAQWEEYYTHVLQHSTGNIGVTELSYGMSAAMLLMAFIDREAFWSASVVSDLKVIHLGVIGWCVLMSGMIVLSFIRVYKKLRDPRLFCSAVGKLLSPLGVAVAPFLIPRDIIQSESRYISLAVGLCFSVLTIKMIVSSMAKMAFGTLQLEVVPLLAGCLWLKGGGGFGGLTTRVLSLFYGLRLLWWVNTAITQICKRLDIYCFSIKKKRAD